MPSQVEHETNIDNLRAEFDVCNIFLKFHSLSRKSFFQMFYIKKVSYT